MPMYPRDRLLAFLAKIANEPGPDLEPRDWLEYYLDKIAENGGGGGCECGVSVIYKDHADWSGRVTALLGGEEDFESGVDGTQLYAYNADEDAVVRSYNYYFVSAAAVPVILSSTEEFTENELLGETYTVENYTFDPTDEPVNHFVLTAADKVIFSSKSVEGIRVWTMVIVGNFTIVFTGRGSHIG